MVRRIVVNPKRVAETMMEYGMDKGYIHDGFTDAFADALDLLYGLEGAVYDELLKMREGKV